MVDAAARAARRQVEKIVAACGGTVKAETEGRSYVARAIAPVGQHWDDELHEYISSVFVGPWSYAEVWNDLLQRVQGNQPEPCHADCEYWEG